VSSAQTNGVSQAHLSSIFGRATLVNGFVASAAGVISNELVGQTATFTSPFILSAVLLGVSYLLIRRLWSENFGGQSAEGLKVDIFQVARLKQAWSIVRRGKKNILGLDYPGPLLTIPFLQIHRFWY